MPHTVFMRRVKLIVPILSVSVAASFALTAWSLYSARQQFCSSRTQTLNVLRDIVVIATQPDRKHPLTVDQMRQVAAFRAAAFARINKARC